MYNRGEITKKTLDEWERETKGKLPERVKRKKKKRAKKKKSRKSKNR